MKSTKFIGLLICVLGLFATAFAGKFSGELGVYVAGMYGAFVGGNSYVTGKALSNGKDPNGTI